MGGLNFPLALFFGLLLILFLHVFVVVARFNPCFGRRQFALEFLVCGTK